MKEQQYQSKTKDLDFVFLDTKDNEDQPRKEHDEEFVVLDVKDNEDQPRKENGEEFVVLDAKDNEDQPRKENGEEFVVLDTKDNEDQPRKENDEEFVVLDVKDNEDQPRKENGEEFVDLEHEGQKKVDAEVVLKSSVTQNIYDSEESMTLLMNKMKSLDQEIIYYRKVLADLVNEAPGGFAEREIADTINQLTEERMAVQLEYDSVWLKAFDQLTFDD